MENYGLCFPLASNLEGIVSEIRRLRLPNINKCIAFKLLEENFDSYYKELL